MNLDQLNNVIHKKLPKLGQKYARDLAPILSLEMEEDVKNVFTVSNVTNNYGLCSNGTVLHANHISVDLTIGNRFMYELKTMLNDRQLHEIYLDCFYSPGVRGMMKFDSRMIDADRCKPMFVLTICIIFF